jgi:hypothetical protein
MAHTSFSTQEGLHHNDPPTIMPPPANGIPVTHGVLETHGNFDLVKRVKLDFTDVTVSKWRSRVTGLSIVHLDYEGKHI